MLEGWLPGKTFVGARCVGCCRQRRPLNLDCLAEVSGRPIAPGSWREFETWWSQAKIGLAAHEEVDRLTIRPPLMDQLEERMLAVGARLTPDHRTGGDAQRLAVAGRSACR